MQTLYSRLVGKMLAGVAGGGVYSSSDDGATWQPPPRQRHGALGDRLEHARLPGVLFAATAAASTARRQRLDVDAGERRHHRHDPAGLHDEKRPNTIYASGTDGVFRTINGGITWSDVEGPIGHQSAAVRCAASCRCPASTRRACTRAPTNGVYAGTTGNGLFPGPVRWRKVDNQGLGNNTIIWTLKSFTTTPGVLGPARSPTAATR